MVLIFPYCHRSSTLTVDQVLLWGSYMTTSTRCRCSLLLILSICCLYTSFSRQSTLINFAFHETCQSLFLSYLSKSQDLFFFLINLEIMGNLTQGRQFYVLCFNMHHLHFWTRVYNQYEVQFYHSWKSLEIPSKTLVNSTIVLTLQDSILIDKDFFDPGYTCMLSFHLISNSGEIQSSSLHFRGISVPWVVEGSSLYERWPQRSDNIFLLTKWPTVEQFTTMKYLSSWQENRCC